MQFKRRYSNYRLSERKQDFGHILTKMINDKNQASLRQSINVLNNEDKIFQWINRDNSLTSQCINNLVKYVQKEVLIIGLILPKDILINCYEVITGKVEIEGHFNSTNIFSTIIPKNINVNVTTLLLFLEEDNNMLDNKSNLKEQFIFDLSFIFIATNQYVNKRTSEWLNRQSFFQITPSLLLINQKQEWINPQWYSVLQDIFWNIETTNVDQMQYKNGRKIVKEFKRHERSAYLQLTQGNQQIMQLSVRINQMSLIALKKNWRASKGLLCYPTFYIINYLIKGDFKDKRQIIENSLLNYCKSLQEQFIKIIQNFNLPIDQLKLRDSMARQKRILILNARKHFTIFQYLFFQQELIQKYLDNLIISFNEKEKDLFHQNNNIGRESNYDILQKLYQQIINQSFQSSHQERTIQDHQRSFQLLLNQYQQLSIRISSQLKTFNDFIKEKKYQYAQNIRNDLRNNKRKPLNEKQQLKDRLQIQTGVLQTLETQLKQLQEKRRKIQLENALLKEDIYGAYKKRNVKEYQNQSTNRRALQIQQEKFSRKNSKTLAKTNKLKNKQNQKRCCYCCQIM